MRFILLAVAVQLLSLHVKGNDVQDGGKRVVCMYEPETYPNNRTLLPEDIDASLCTHLISFKSDINIETGQMVLRGNSPYAGKDYVNRVLKLKENNSELKVLIHLRMSCSNSWISTKSGWSSLINNIIEFLRLHGIDGVKINVPFTRDEDCIGELLCEMRAEFDKQGFILTTFLPPIAVLHEVEQDFYDKNRCYNFFIDLTMVTRTSGVNVTTLSSPLPSVKSLVDLYLAKGFPAKKLVISVTAFAVIFNLKNLNETGIGAEISKDRGRSSDPIKYDEMVEMFNDPSEQWTIRRDEASNSPYGFNINGLWASYEDPSSVATKAQYVVENQLGGAAIFLLDFDDHKGIAGEGKFPLTRKLHDIIIGGKENETHALEQ